MTSRSFRTLLVLVGVLAIGASALAAPPLPVPRTHVADYGNLIDPKTEREIDGYLTELEQKTGAQVIILTVQTTGGEDIFDYTFSIAEQWKLGQKGKDNGALVCVAKDEQKARVEVGYGLEGVLPDAWCKAMEDQLFVPNFKKGDYATGLREGAVAIANQIADSDGVQLSGIPATRVRRHGNRVAVTSGCSSVIFLIIIISIVSRIFRRRGRYYRSWGGGGLLEGMIIGSMLGGMGRRSGWSNWGGGGGFGGGGFGGGSFGGGGGGGFGGGGASCGW